MELHNISIFIFALTAFGVISSSAFHSNISKRIIGGDDAPDGTFPFMVALRNASSNAHFCGGAILHTHWIVTAHHCVKTKEANEIYVAVGSPIRTEGTIYAISKIISYPHYPNNDLALLRTKTDMDFSNPKEVNFISYGTVIREKEMPRVFGWGFLKPNGPKPMHLKYLDTEIKKFGCAEGPKRTRGIPGYICSFKDKNHRVCNGDSGGPLVFKEQLVGIVSVGDMECNLDKWDAYAKISFYTKWLNDTMSQG